jgi:hypothetical protein
MLLPFNQYTPNLQAATLSLIEAYQTALKLNSSTLAKKGNLDYKPSQWKIKHLKRFLNELFMGTAIPSEKIGEAVR